MESKKNVKCELTGMEAFFSNLRFMNWIPWMLLIEYVYKVSIRSKKKKIIFPSFVSYRTYGPVSCAEVCLNSLHAYGIPTNLMNCWVDIEEVDGECHKFIEAQLAVPSNRVFMADVLLRQHATSTYSSIVITSKVRYSNNVPSTRYQNNPPMVPKGIPFKPFTISDVITISLLGAIFNDGVSKVKNGKPKSEIGKNPRKELLKDQEVERIKHKPVTKRKNVATKKIVVKTSNPKKAKLWKG